MSREDSLKEAGRLGTEAEGILGEANKLLAAGGARASFLEAKRAAAGKFRQAIEHWRTAGDLDRLFAGTEELTRIYFGLGDFEGVDIIMSLSHF